MNLYKNLMLLCKICIKINDSLPIDSQLDP